MHEVAHVVHNRSRRLEVHPASVFADKVGQAVLCGIARRAGSSLIQTNRVQWADYKELLDVLSLRRIPTTRPLAGPTLSSGVFVVIEERDVSGATI